MLKLVLELIGGFMVALPFIVHDMRKKEQWFKGTAYNKPVEVDEEAVLEVVKLFQKAQNHSDQEEEKEKVA